MLLGSTGDQFQRNAEGSQIWSLTFMKGSRKKLQSCKGLEFSLFSSHNNPANDIVSR